MATMPALVWENNKINLQDVEIPLLKKANDVKVKIYGTGICGTDLNLLKGKISATEGMILGHESVGEVVEIGSEVKMVEIGDRVIIDPTQFCGKCDNCRSGLTCYCDNFDDWQLGIGAHGTFTDFYVGDERFLYKIPESMSWEQALLVEPLSCVLNAVDQANIKPWDSVLVIGGGPIGALCQLICEKMARLSVIIELNKSRRESLSELVSIVLHPGELAMEKLIEINGSRKFDIVIDAVGNQLELAQSHVEKDGRIIPMGFDDSVDFTIKPFHYLSNGFKLIGTGEVRQIAAKALRLAKAFPKLEKLVTGKYPLTLYDKVFSVLLSKDKTLNGKAIMKAVLISNL